MMRVALFEFDGTLDAQEILLRRRIRERTDRRGKPLTGWTHEQADDVARLLRVQRAQARRMKHEAR